MVRWKGDRRFCQVDKIDDCPWVCCDSTILLLCKQRWVFTFYSWIAQIIAKRAIWSDLEIQYILFWSMNVCTDNKTYIDDVISFIYENIMVSILSMTKISEEKRQKAWHCECFALSLSQLGFQVWLFKYKIKSNHNWGLRVDFHYEIDRWPIVDFFLVILLFAIGKWRNSKPIESSPLVIFIIRSVIRKLSQHTFF